MFFSRYSVKEFLTERRLLLKVATDMDAILIAAPTSTKNKDKARDPHMHSSKKGSQWYFGMKVHIGMDAESGLVHTVRSTFGNISDIDEASSLLHGHERFGFGDAGYRGIEKRPDTRPDVIWHIAIRPSKREKLNKNNEADALLD